MIKNQIKRIGIQEINSVTIIKGDRVGSILNQPHKQDEYYAQYKIRPPNLEGVSQLLDLFQCAITGRNL